MHAHILRELRRLLSWQAAASSSSLLTGELVRKLPYIRRYLWMKSLLMKQTVIFCDAKHDGTVSMVA